MDNKFFDAKDTVLNNGLRVVTIKKSSQIASIQCGVRVGSLYESSEERGMAHFIEHMLFKGTDSRDNEKLNSDLEFLGGEYNAYTDYANTVYTVTILEEEIENAVELLSSMLINSTFPEEEIKKEKEVVLAELSSSNDDVEDLSYRMVNSCAFKNSPLRNDVIGVEETIKSFNRDSILSFYCRYYLPKNCCITIASPLDHDKALKLVELYFGKWKTAEVNKPKVIVEKNLNIKKTTFKSNIEQSTIVYLYTFYGIDREKELVLRVLNHKLGESANSILFRELREKKGLAYDVYTHLDTTSLVKSLYIYTAVKDKYIKEAMECIDDCIEQLKTGRISLNDNMLDLMKKVLKTAVASTLEDSTDLASYVLHQCLDEENIYQFAEDMQKIQNIKQDEIYSVAKEVFNAPTIHILKPKK